MPSWFIWTSFMNSTRNCSSFWAKEWHDEQCFREISLKTIYLMEGMFADCQWIGYYRTPGRVLWRRIVFISVCDWKGKEVMDWETLKAALLLLPQTWEASSVIERYLLNVIFIKVSDLSFEISLPQKLDK